MPPEPDSPDPNSRFRDRRAQARKRRRHHRSIALAVLLIAAAAVALGATVIGTRQHGFGKSADQGKSWKEQTKPASPRPMPEAYGAFKGPFERAFYLNSGENQARSVNVLPGKLVNY